MKKIISSAALVAMSAMLTLTSVGVEAGPKGCKAQKLKYKLPEERSSIDPGAGFSAQASHRIQIDTLKFSIKGSPIDINITTKGNGVHVIEGTIPADTSSGFARIKVTGKDRRGCKLVDGWLLKVTGEEVAVEEKAVPTKVEAKVEAVEEAPAPEAVEETPAEVVEEVPAVTTEETETSPTATLTTETEAKQVTEE